ncbi:MAG: alpha/beta fold hydrolase [Acidimicrobiales bacterium]|nr:alpha/beta fold hydrolase [Acidimicrobiales bacterium]
MTMRTRRWSRRRFLGAAGAAGVLVACGDDEAPTPVDDLDGPGPMTTERLDYGAHEDQVGDLWLPAGLVDPVPVVVLIHGGFWLQQFDLGLMDPLAESLARAGYAAWNIEYRRVGGAGGYPQTFDDVAAAVDHLAVLDDDRLDVARVAVVGHSAGGHLAAWVASRGALPDDAPWADPAVRPVVAFPQAGVLDLVACAENRVGGTACPDLLRGTPAQEPEHYALTSPIELLPIGVPVIAVHGDDDGNVPLAQSETYVDRAVAAGDPAELVVVDGADHFDVIDPAHESWTAILDRLPDHL